MAKFKNNEERKRFLESYKDWGIEFEIPVINEVFYKHELSNGNVIIAREVKQRRVEAWWIADDEEFYYTVTYYLLDMENEKELFSDSKKSMTEIVDYLRAIKE